MTNASHLRIEDLINTRAKSAEFNRKKVVDYIREGHTLQEAMEYFKFNYSRVNRYAREGNVKNPPKPRLNPQKVLLFVKRNPELTLSEIARYFGYTHRGMRKFLRRHGIKVKKYQFPIDELWDFVLANPHLKIEDYAKEFNVSYNTASGRLKQLGLKPHITWKKENKNDEKTS